MKSVAELLAPYTSEKIDSHLEVSEITNKSKEITNHCLFFAESGIHSHGLDHLSENKIKRLTAIAWQPPYSDIDQFSKYQNKFIKVDNLNQKLGFIAKDFYGNSDTDAFTLVGVTGTNGKTSTSHFIAQLTGYSIIGTTGYGLSDSLVDTPHTTPDALFCQKIIKTLRQESKGVCMEVSSHALAQNRVSAIAFKTAIFTNLSQDHLDYHKTIENYFLAKQKLFESPSVKNAIINIDDPYAERLIHTAEQNKQTVYAYGNSKKVLSFKEHLYFDDITLSQNGIICNIQIQLNGIQKRLAFSTPIWGKFNLYNLSAAILCAYTTGANIDAILLKAKQLKGICGRIEPIYLNQNKTVIIDYSHTPDALKNVLESLSAQTTGNIYTVFGCGGDRDKGKRPLMAEVVNANSDFGIITDDNPRTEKSEDIIADIYQGEIDQHRFKIISDRKEAILFALNQLNKNDTLLIAGKGHETYQIIGTEKIHFSDHEVVLEWINAHI